MEPEENLSKMEVAEVPKDPSITLARKINSAIRENRRVKAKVAKEEKLKKRLSVVERGGGGHGVGRSGHEHGRGRGLGHGATTDVPTIRLATWSEHYKTPYLYAAKQLRTAIGKVPYIIDVNTTPLFPKCSSPQLARAWKVGGGADGSPHIVRCNTRAMELTYDNLDRDILDIIHDSGGGGAGGFGDMQVEESDPIQSGNYPQQ